MTNEADFYLVLSFWIVALALLLTRAWFGRSPVVGFTLAYWLHLWLIHWMGAFIQVLPWHFGPYRTETIAGFNITGYAMAGLLAGNLLLAPLFLPVPKRFPGMSQQRLNPSTYIWIGLGCSFGISAVLPRIPSMTAVLSAGLSLAVAGFCLWWWKLREAGHPLKAWWVLAGSLVLPACTVVLHGFIGFGVVACLMIACFAASFLRPRWAVLLGGFTLLFLGLSLYPTYMQVRNEIRRVVWGGERYQKRITTVATSLHEHWQWFDSTSRAQLDAIEGRLNQNWLVGKAVLKLDGGVIPFADGETLWQSALALIPRIIWPDKPAYAGSKGLVTRFTGITFAEGTSVGIGHVMEAYVNFGRPGVFVAFLVMGLLLAVADFFAVKYLLAGDGKRLVLWLVMGQPLLMVGGNFAEMTASIVGGAVLCMLVNKFLIPSLPPSPRPLVPPLPR